MSDAAAAPAPAGSTKELTVDGARVTTIAEGSVATAPPPREPGLVATSTFVIAGAAFDDVQAFLLAPESWPTLTGGPFADSVPTRIDDASFRCASADGPQGVQSAAARVPRCAPDRTLSTRVEEARLNTSTVHRWMWIFDQSVSECDGARTLTWRVCLGKPEETPGPRPGGEKIFSVLQVWVLAPGDGGGVSVTRTVSEFEGPDFLLGMLESAMLPAENAKVAELLSR